MALRSAVAARLRWLAAFGSLPSRLALASRHAKKELRTNGSDYEIDKQHYERVLAGFRVWRIRYCYVKGRPEGWPFFFGEREFYQIVSVALSTHSW